MAEPHVAEAPKVMVQPELSGIGGWLILMLLGQIVGPIRAFINVVIYYTDLELIPVFKKFPVAMYGEMVLNLV